MRMRIILFSAILAAFALPAHAADEIVLGHYASLTGATATFGTSTRDGIELARDEINAKGGVLGKQVVVKHEDDQSRIEEARTAVEKLISRDKVIAVLGEVSSSKSIAAAPSCQRAHIPMLPPAS